MGFILDCWGPLLYHGDQPTERPLHGHHQSFEQNIYSFRWAGMREYDDKTAIGGPDVRFPATAWTKILDPSLQGKMLEQLSVRYWKPLYFYLRRKGFGNDEAKDLTQGFFSEVVLGGRLVQSADRTRGKFRTLLLTALDRYAAGTHRRNKREPVLTPNRELFSDDIPTDVPNDPIKAFNYAWASTLLEDVLDELENRCRSDGKGVHWKVFRAKVLEPILDDGDTPSLTEICAEYSISSTSKASNMIVTVKRRFQSILKRRLRQTVDSGVQLEGAFQEFLQIFSKPGARY